jgi:truncated hemoglobin YjbI
MLHEAHIDRAKRLLRGFNREECAAQFESLLSTYTDDIPVAQLAFAHWAIAYCHGADYNMYGSVYEGLRDTGTWPSLKTAQRHIERVANLLSESDEAWKIVFEASRLRFFTKNLRKYATFLDAKLAKYTHFEDPMLYAVHAEAHMLLEPWKLWDRSTTPFVPTENAKMVETILNNGLKKFPTDEWLCHLKVHFCEMGPRNLFDLKILPSLEKSVNGHLRHMPSHLYIQLGDYRKSRDLNVAAVEVDAKDRMSSTSSLSIYAFYECHNLHFVVFASCMCGDYDTAYKYAHRLSEFVSNRRLEKNPITHALCEAFMMVEIMTYVRFGEWDTLLHLTNEKDVQPTESTYNLFLEYGKSIAHAAKNQTSKARVCHATFVDLLNNFNPTKMLHNEKVINIGKLASLVSQAEILFREDDVMWVRVLEEAMILEGNLAYDEPPAWMIPVRQTIAALLIAPNNDRTSRDRAKAIQSLKEDLDAWPNNVWSSAALAKCGEDVDTSVFMESTVNVQTSCACANR